MPAPLALLGGTPVGPVIAPHWPRFKDEALAEGIEALRAGKAIGLGRFHSPEIAAFEEAVSSYHDGHHVLGTSSGHGALVSGLAGLEICDGDEVITTPYTWGASISCILHQGAVPIFVDVLPETGLLDPDKVEAAITPRTKGILVVHLFGQPGAIARLRAIADRHNLSLIEDCSQGHGAVADGRKVGTVGDAAGFSCMGGKVLASTEAGFLVTPHERVYWKAALAGQHMGRAPEKDFPDDLRPYADSLVHTYRITPFNAIILRSQLALLDGQLSERRRHADLLHEALRKTRFFKSPDYGTNRPSYHMFTMTVDADAIGVSRNRIIAALKAEGLHAFAYIPAPASDWSRFHWQDYQGPRVPWIGTLQRSGVDYRNLPLPNCRWRVAHALEIRFDYVEPRDAEVQRIAEILQKVDAGMEALAANP